MSMLAAIRPDDWNFPLFLHVLGAMILVGGVLTGATALALARGSANMLRTGYYSLLAVALPGFILMRVGAAWIADKEGVDDENSGAWVGIGFIVADPGGLLLVISLILGGAGVYRLRNGKGTRLLKATMVISVVLLVAYLVAVWAMTAKPDA